MRKILAMNCRVYLSVGAFLLAIAAVSQADHQIQETAIRVPRALILQPVSKLREEEEGPLDWLANIFRGMVSPRKSQPYQPPPMLGPIRIPGMDDEVYIKQLDSHPNTQNRVVVRVMNPGRGQMPGQMGISSSYYTYQPVFPIAPTRQVPMQSAGFVPMASPTPTAPWSHPQFMRGHYPMNYNKNMYPNSYNHPQGTYHQYRAPQSHYEPPYSPRYPQNPYGSYDFDNSISHGRGSRYGEPLKTTNYPIYPPLNEHHLDHQVNINPQHHHNGIDHHEIRNETESSEDVYDSSRESALQYPNVDQSKELLSESKVTDKYKEIYRPDRMVPTNPTWRNRFWTRAQKTTTASPTTERSADEKNQKSTESVKFSSTEIKEIVAPDLKDWKERNEKNEKREGKEEKRRTDSRMDEGEVEKKDGLMLGKGESQEYMEKRFMNIRSMEGATEKPRVYEKIRGRKRNNWKPMEPKSTVYPVYSAENQDLSPEVSTEAVTSEQRSTTPAFDRVENSTGNYSRQNEGKRAKMYQRKLGKSNRRVRIVESVSSSVSVTSSRGKGKPKSS
ncbi:uncharacterized protein [Fopius arisanus]|uniref:Uncharacterized protein isoform X1 n=1 Tax=Fopius arisanus TaxID=64838 RepID=A0A0C9QJ07_9HYME|nr:PREDICTED: uncharacterized protein LOC105264759 isoform X1 [Fopius arisanus]